MAVLHTARSREQRGRECMCVIVCAYVYVAVCYYGLEVLGYRLKCSHVNQHVHMEHEEEVAMTK